MAGLSYVNPSSILDDMPVEVRFLALKNAWANKVRAHPRAAAVASDVFAGAHQQLSPA